MNATVYLGAMLSACLALCTLSPDLHAAKPANNANYAKQYEQFILRGVKLHDTFQINDQETVRLDGTGWPAFANIWTEPANFLLCNPPQGQDFAYALCYYSGPDDPSGLSSDNPALPCTLSPNGKSADCKCFKLDTAVVPPQVPYFVDINAILNLDIYQQTVAVCGEDGAGCAPSTSIEAPVCRSINTSQLIAGAKIVSVFSPVKKLDYYSGSTPCDAPGSVYAGCMTAPCYDTGEVDAHGNALVDCSCPIYQGPFEIGQGPSADGPQDCNLGHGNLWSAAHNPLKNDPIDPPAPTENCIPDAPPESGCPLWNDAVTGLDPESTVCQAVCSAYQSTDDEGIQPGYACDSTLCTTLGIGQELPFDGLAAESKVRLDLMAQACKGIGELPRLGLIATVEELAGCSCCASQLCGCASETADINENTNKRITELNVKQVKAEIVPQCIINGTLCGEYPTLDHRR